MRRSHPSHKSVRKTYELIVDLYWWPLLKKDIESMIYNCKLCQESNRTLVTSQSLIDSDNFCWQHMKRVFLDITGPFSSDNEKYAIVMIDQASRWPELFLTQTVTSAVVIDKLKKIFSRLGTPDEIRCDNGPQFVSKTFREFVEDRKIKLILSPNYNPS